MPTGPPTDGYQSALGYGTIRLVASCPIFIATTGERAIILWPYGSRKGTDNRVNLPDGTSIQLESREEVWIGGGFIDQKALRFGDMDLEACVARTDIELVWTLSGLGNPGSSNE